MKSDWNSCGSTRRTAESVWPRWDRSRRDRGGSRKPSTPCCQGFAEFRAELGIAIVQHVATAVEMSHPRMVKKLDLLESDHGCGPNGLSWESIPKTEVKQRYTVHT